jgi:hypothetical protein
MPRVGFEPTILVFERAKMVHALDRAATVIGPSTDNSNINMKYTYNNWSFAHYYPSFIVSETGFCLRPQV